jgi:hypothetical protein
MTNINSKNYWEKRFFSGDWESNNGRFQTMNFAKSQIKHFDISYDFNGTILDFGCALGDAFPIYNKCYPSAKLIGVDISETAIEFCKKKYNNIANFFCGSYIDVPNVDIIIASNIFEHLDNDIEVAKYLMTKCKKLYIIVPYKESPLICFEHVNIYDEYYFDVLGKSRFKIFTSYCWGPNNFISLLKFYIKNSFLVLKNEKVCNRPSQILFEFKIE